MFKTIISFVIFIVITLIYLHFREHNVQVHCNECFTYDITSKKEFENYCKDKVPFVYKYGISPEEEKLIPEAMRSTFSNYDIHVNDNEINLQHFYDAAVDVSSESSYTISTNNTTFINDTDIIDNIRLNDDFLKPSFITNSVYDLWLANKMSCTNVYKSKFHRSFLHCLGDSCKVKLISPKYDVYIDTQVSNYNVHDEINKEINFWENDSEKNTYNKTINKIKTVDVTMTSGDILYIPQHWSYSAQFGENTSVVRYSYITYMNNLLFINRYIDIAIHKMKHIYNVYCK